jgi:Raf kinase inhibitor-like YbhB/YbcL family protein/uncharacterized protein (TIGR00297 family)
MASGSSFSVAQLIIGLILAAGVAFLATRFHALNRSGAFAAALLGTVVFGLGGWPWAVLLIAFFVTSSGLSKLFARRKRSLDEKFSKGSERDAGQVAANGAIAGIFVLLHQLVPGAAWPWIGFAGTLAAVNADTWATELGVLSKRAPRMITTGKPAEAGTSGAISLAGTTAAFSGAFVIALLAVLVRPVELASISGFYSAVLVVCISVAGLVAALVDSLFGATVQAIYTCPTCHKETERHPLHVCGTPTVLKRGLPWLNNDWVNIACALSGALLAVLFLFILRVPQTSSKQNQEVLMTLTLSSQAFENGQAIPVAFTCDGEDRSPDLTWSGQPAGTRSLALIVSDPDAPMGTFYHWVIYNLPPQTAGLPEGTGSKTGPLPAGSLQGPNSFGKNQYGGPCPPAGKAHRYFFTLYALDLAPNLPARLNAVSLQKIMEGHILAQGQWMGTFSH